MKVFLKLVLSFCLASTITISSVSQAGVAVVVSQNNTTQTMSIEEVRRLFLKKNKSFKSGVKAEPLDQVKENKVRNMFYKKVVNKGPSQLTSYWSRMIFTGKGTPPKVAGNDESVINSVSKNVNAIGYIDSASVDKRVKVLLTVN